MSSSGPVVVPAPERAFRPSASTTSGTGHWGTKVLTNSRVPGSVPRPGPSTTTSRSRARSERALQGLGAQHAAEPVGQRLGHELRTPSRNQRKRRGRSGHRDEAGPGAQSAQCDQDGRPRLADGARDDEHVALSCPCGTPGAAAESSAAGRLPRAGRAAAPPRPGCAPGSRCRRRPARPPGRRREAGRGPASGAPKVTVSRGHDARPVADARVREQARGDVHGHDGRARDGPGRHLLRWPGRRARSGDRASPCRTPRR